MSHRIREQLAFFPKSDEVSKRKSPDGVTTSKLVCTAHVGTNEELFPLILNLHVPPGSVVADVTYGKGIFWKNVPKDRYTLLATDIEDDVDCRSLAYEDGTIDCVVLDPPYMEGLYRRSETHMAGSGTYAAHREHGGLEQKQVTTAMEFVAAVDRINIGKSNTPPEDQCKTIFREYKSARESGFDLYAAAGDIIRGSSLTDMVGSLQRHSGGAEDKAIAHAMKKFSVTERRLRAIIQEGEDKNW